MICKINKFSVVGGPKLNVQKLECMLLKLLRHLCYLIDGIIIVTSKPVKILSIYTGYNKDYYYYYYYK